MHSTKTLDILWDQYMRDNPHAKAIYDLFVAQGEQPVNDHIALRTLDDPRIDIHVLAQPFLDAGYRMGQYYDFEAKKLKALHLEPQTEDEPKVFISQLLTKEFSPYLQQSMQACADAIPEELLNDPDRLLTSGISWMPVSYEVYEKLLEESEYAAWFYVFGFRANHFTIFINRLRHFDEVVQVNNFLKEHGFTLNSSGGEVKGTPDDLLEQSSTVSGTIEVAFVEGKRTIPCCYFEFAKRYADASGRLYQGFVAKSADKIFESTNVRG